MRPSALVAKPVSDKTRLTSLGPDSFCHSAVYKPFKGMNLTLNVPGYIHFRDLESQI